jgi:hypothetical protein
MEHARTMSMDDLKSRILAGLEKVLRETLFTSNTRLLPRQIHEVAQEMTSSFFQFLDDGNGRIVSLHGQKLARDGISPHAILAMAESVRRACWEDASPMQTLLPASGDYVGALLEGYIPAREAFVLQQQDQIRRAFQRAFERTRS